MAGIAGADMTKAVAGKRPAAHSSPGAALPESLTLAGMAPLLAAIYEGPLESPPWQTALEALREHLRADTVTLILRPPSSASGGVMISAGPFKEQGVHSYQAHFFAIDPFVRLREGEVVSAEELLGPQWLESEYYREHLGPLGVRHLLGTDIYTREGIECRLRVARGHDAAAFSRADKAAIEFLLPHLKQSIQLHARIDRLECERRLFGGAINRILVGTISFTHDGAIAEINDEAMRILEEKDGLSLQAHTLCIAQSTEGQEFKRLIRTALLESEKIGETAQIGAMSITRPSGRPRLSLLVRSVPWDPWSESQQRPAVMVFLRDPESQGVPLSRELVQRLFDLTRSEAEIAILLSKGLTLEEVSEALGIQRTTARTHLRSIFGKTGVTRQTTLVRLLMNSVLTLG